MATRKGNVDPRCSRKRVPPSRDVLLNVDAINKHVQQTREMKKTYPPHLANVIQLLVYQLGRTKRKVILLTSHRGRLLSSLSRKASVDIVHCTSVPATVDDLNLGGAHDLLVDILDVLGRQQLDAIGKL